MLRALIYLRLTSLRNWVLWRVRRLRQPKYLVGAVVGVAYFYFFFVRRMGVARHPPLHPHGHNAVAPVAAELPTEWLPVALGVGAVILLVVLVFSWVVPTQRAALGFSEAEISFLFPAPVTRRALVHFRLISAQLRSLVAALLMALVSNRWTVFGGNALTHALGWWFIFSTLNLHYTGATFALTRVADRGHRTVGRRIALVLALVAVVAVSLWRLPPAQRLPVASNGSLSVFSTWIGSITTAAPLAWLLYPLKLVLAPFFASDGRTFLIALGPAFAVILLHYLWVVATVTSFEDASIVQAERRAARLAAVRTGERRFGSPGTTGRKPPFALAHPGRPELAFVWKNLLATWPYFNARVFAACAVVIVVASAWAQRHPAWAALRTAGGVLGGFTGLYILVIGPQFARQDVRSDLRKLDVLKTYPLAGWQIVLGEVLTPTLILTGIAWLMLLLAVLNLEAHGAFAWLTPGVRVSCALVAVIMVPPLALLQLLVPNAAALIFPGWAEATRARGGGPEVMGQRMIFLFAQLLTMVAVLVPAALVGGALLALVHLFLGPELTLLIAAPPVAGVLVAEAVAGLWWLGRRFEHLDLTDELRT